MGDYASYDPRNQDVSRTVARLFRAAGVDFGLLYESERTAGNDVRRVGEEGLFESLTEHNLEAMGAAQQFDAIVTTDPHSYNTIRNEYPDFGEVAPIRHYTSVLAELMESGRLTVTKPLGKRVTLHDPCHLGRLNGHYDEPRRVLELIGCVLIDMPRCRDNSFCCGAGGGRIWMPDPVGKEKPAENRMHEAASLGNLDTFVVCCPKDLTMFEDARKTSGHEDDFVVQDLAELVAEAIDLKSIDLKEVPSLVDRITEAAAVRIADAVAESAGRSPRRRRRRQGAERSGCAHPCPRRCRGGAATCPCGRAGGTGGTGARRRPVAPGAGERGCAALLRGAGEGRPPRARRGQAGGRAEPRIRDRRERQHDRRRALRARVERVGTRPRWRRRCC